MARILKAGLAGLAVTIPWLVTTLVLNLGIVAPGTNGGGISIPPQWPQGGSGFTSSGGIVIGGGAAQGTGVLVAIFAAFALLLALVAWHSRGADFQYKSGNPILYVISLGLALLLIYGTVVFASVDPLAFALQTPTLPNLIPFFAFGALVVCAVVGIVFVLGRRDASPVEQRITISTGAAASEVASILDDTAASLGSGSEYRAAILGCYRAICSVLERQAPMDSSKLTAREFESVAARNLGVGRRYLHDATALFERARYSNDFIGKEDSERAQVCLEQLSRLMTPSSARAVPAGAPPH